MARYYVNMNPQDNGDHEVHKSGCYWLGLVKNKKFLGIYTSCTPAVKEAKKTYPTANGCYHCSRPCHTT